MSYNLLGFAFEKYTPKLMLTFGPFLADVNFVSVDSNLIYFTVTETYCGC